MDRLVVGGRGTRATITNGSSRQCQPSGVLAPCSTTDGIASDGALLISSCAAVSVRSVRSETCRLAASAPVRRVGGGPSAVGRPARRGAAHRAGRAAAVGRPRAGDRGDARRARSPPSGRGGPGSCRSRAPTPAVDRQRHVPDAADEDVARVAGRGGRSAPTASGRSSGRGRTRSRRTGSGTPGAGSAQLGDDVAARPQLAGRAGAGPGGPGRCRRAACRASRACAPARRRRGAARSSARSGRPSSARRRGCARSPVSSQICSTASPRLVGRHAGRRRSAGCSSPTSTRPKPRRRSPRRSTVKIERLSTMPCTSRIGVPAASTSPMIRPRCTGCSAAEAALLAAVGRRALLERRRAGTARRAPRPRRPRRRRRAGRSGTSRLAAPRRTAADRARADPVAHLRWPFTCLLDRLSAGPRHERPGLAVAPTYPAGRRPTSSDALGYAAGS